MSLPSWAFDRLIDQSVDGEREKERERERGLVDIKLIVEGHQDSVRSAFSDASFCVVLRTGLVKMRMALQKCNIYTNICNKCDPCVHSSTTALAECSRNMILVYSGTCLE